MPGGKALMVTECLLLSRWLSSPNHPLHVAGQQRGGKNPAGDIVEKAIDFEHMPEQTSTNHAQHGNQAIQKTLGAMQVIFHGDLEVTESSIFRQTPDVSICFGSPSNLAVAT